MRHEARFFTVKYWGLASTFTEIASVGFAPNVTGAFSDYTVGVQSCPVCRQARGECGPMPGVGKELS